MKAFRFVVAAVAAVSLSAALASRLAARTEIANATQPQLAAAADGRVWLVYGQQEQAASSSSHGDHSAHAAGHGAGGEGKKKGGHGPAPRAGGVFVATSTDGGATFSPAVKVATLSKLMVGNRRGPRIAVHGDRVTVTAIGDELVAFSSTDGGKTWSGAVTINDVRESAHEGLHDLGVSPAGELFVSWLDLRNAKMELWGASSKDGGRTWNADQLVYKSPDKSICECCHPSVLFDREGHLAVMWRNSIEGARDMWLTTRAKGAATFTAARKLGEGTWKINGCPHDGGTLVALGDGRFGAVAQRSGEIFAVSADNKETMLGKGRQAVAVGGEGQITVVWNDGSDLVVVRDVRQPTPTKVAADARFPIIVAVPGKGPVLAYERGAKGATSIAVERL
jgi:hypothetical protein